MFSRSKNPVVVMVTVVALAAPCLAQRVIYVYASAAGSMDGTSWADAYRDLQDALDDAREQDGCPCEIWVAAGVYKPDRSTSDRTLSFDLVGNVALLGGFAGLETDSAQRDPSANETILSGDLLGNDNAETGPLSDCCEEGNPGTCSDVACKEDVVKWTSWCSHDWDDSCRGTAMLLCCELCRPTRCDNSYHVVRAENLDTSAMLDGFTIRGGEANGVPVDQRRGGGLFVSSGTITLRNCKFVENGGAAGSAISAADIELVDLEVAGNDAYVFGVAADFFFSQQVVVERCSFRDNTGMAFRTGLGSALIVDSSFVNNRIPATLASGAYVGDATVVRSRFAENHGTALIASSAVVIDSVFEDNETAYGYAGVSTTSGAIFVNSLFARNLANGAPALGNSFGRPVIENCAFVDNEGISLRGSIDSLDGFIIRNSIFWNNRDGYSGTSEEAQLGSYSPEGYDISNTIVQNWTGNFGGTSNSGSDPLFVDPLGPDNVAATGDEDYRLSPDSPAINGGVITANTAGSDLDGRARVLCGAVDLGPYEFGIGDYDCDGQIMASDFAAWPWCMDGPDRVRGAGCEPLDFNGDASVDLFDFAGFQQAFGG